MQQMRYPLPCHLITPLLLVKEESGGTVILHWFAYLPIYEYTVVMHILFTWTTNTTTANWKSSGNLNCIGVFFFVFPFLAACATLLWVKWEFLLGCHMKIMLPTHWMQIWYSIYVLSRIESCNAFVRITFIGQSYVK